MNRLELEKENEKYWNRINSARREFQDFINYEWNYAVHISFHKNFDAKVENTKRMIVSYLNDLRKIYKLVVSSFYIIPKSYVDPEYNPHHIHILLLVFNPKERMKFLLKDTTLKYHNINKSVIHELYNPEAGRYLTKFKNLNLTDLNSFYFDFHKKQLLEKYGNTVGYINEEIKRRLA